MKNRILNSTVLIGAVTFLLNSCSNENLLNSRELNLKGESSTPIINTGFVTNPKNLNIVYFIPNDQTPDPNYRKRLTALYTHFQEYIRKEMERYGFENTNLGLPVDSATGLVKFIEIKGKEGISSYPYKGGDKKIKQEIADYKALNPKEFSSDFQTHVLVLDNRVKKDVPFYGPAGFSFGIDFENMKVENIKRKDLVGSYIGGNLHEMTHGLTINLAGPQYAVHESPRISDTITLGNTLMGTGNGTFGKSKTYISYSFASILNRNDVFQRAARDYKFYEKANVDIEITKEYFNDETKSIEIEGIINSTDKEISDVSAYCRELPYKGGSYDVGFRGELTSNKFKVSIPIIDLQTLVAARTGYSFIVKFIFKNGAHFDKVLNGFKVENNKAIFDNDVYAFQNCGYAGYKIALKIGNYTKQDLLNIGIKDKDISGIFIPEGLGLKVTLYNNDNFTGESYSTTKSIDCKFNDKTTSLKVEKLNN